MFDPIKIQLIGLQSCGIIKQRSPKPCSGSGEGQHINVQNSDYENFMPSKHHTSTSKAKGKRQVYMDHDPDNSKADSRYSIAMHMFRGRDHAASTLVSWPLARSTLASRLCLDRGRDQSHQARRLITWYRSRIEPRGYPRHSRLALSHTATTSLPTGLELDLRLITI